jgi:hypothetical protein
LSSTVIHIKLKRGGWEVELDVPEDRVSEVISKVLAGLNAPGPGEGGSLAQERPDRGVTCKTLLEKLWNESWFSSLRGLSDVDEELARMGYHYDKTAISHSLTDLVREGLLSREGTPRSYRYIQKKPPENPLA